MSMEFTPARLTALAPDAASLKAGHQLAPPRKWSQLGGGTDIHKALRYCEGLVRLPLDTVTIIVSDLCDDGQPSFDRRNAGRLAALGVPVFACTPELFPDLMAAALAKRDLRLRAASRGVKMTRQEAPATPT